MDNEREFGNEVGNIRFFYRPVRSGWISTSGPSILIWRVHTKSFVVGIGRENYGFDYDDRPGDALDINPDINGTVSPRKDITIFNRTLWSRGNSLRFLNMEIGFLENQICMINNPLFTTLVKKVLGETWTIKHCS